MRYAQIFRKIRVIIFQTVVIIILTFFLGEIALRIYNNYVPSFIFYSSSYERFRGKPFADNWNFNLNSQGFNDEEFSEKKDDTYRILGIGDSFSFGVVPYENNYLTLIESQFHLENVSVELLNMGISNSIYIYPQFTNIVHNTNISVIQYSLEAITHDLYI